MKIRFVILFLVIIGHPLTAQNMWMWNQRTHPELEWQTLETAHFNIHFHQGLEDIAARGALIAEQAYQPIMDQVQVKDFGKTDMVFSAEDEIMNGFAMPSNQIFIWVSQNDVAGNFGGSDKWLKLVITHEFQHVVQFQAHRTWAGIWAGASIPAWWIEGMAEYMTEVWRVGRSDSRMKIHTYRNTMDKLDAHDDGYAKVLYLAWKYGDSTLVKISKHRLYLLQDQKKLPYWYDFETAFKTATGQTLEDFNEEWRRAMNTYYYGYKAQKETIEEVGEPFILKGFSRIQSAILAPDSSRIAVISRQNSQMRDYSFYLVNTDSTKKVQEIHSGRFSGQPAWSPSGQKIVVSEYHRGSHGSLIHDLRLLDLGAGKKEWITKDIRALHPVFSDDGRGVYFVAHPSETTQIYYYDIVTGNQNQLTHFKGDVQLQSLNLSPDGKRLAFMIQDASGDVNIATIQIDGTQFQTVTNDPEEDLYPVWTSDGKAIVFTSYRNSTPNLFRVDLDSMKLVQMTDVAEGIYSRQLLAQTGQIVASTLNDVDTVRIRLIEPDRVAPELGLHIRVPFSAWRSKAPDIQMPEFNDEAVLEKEVHPYEAFRTFRPLFKLIWPFDTGLLAMAGISDALGKHLIQGGVVLPYDGSDWGGYFNYTNLEFLPAVNFFGAQNLVMQYHNTYRYRFLEFRNGIGMTIQVPMNSGNSLASNHALQVKIQAYRRGADSFETDDQPIAGVLVTSPMTEELKLGLTYTWKSQRPHTDIYFLPRDGTGFQAHYEMTVPSIWGENDYSQYWLDGFMNYDIPRLPLVFYSRLKYAGQRGSILVQDELGFSEHAPFYFSTQTMRMYRSTGIFDAPESYNLRGQVGHYAAGDLLYSSTELRMPLVKKLPINILGLSIQNVTAAVFLDYGYIPESELSMNTSGGEFRFDVSLMKLPLVTLAYGWGGDSDYWNRDNNESDFWAEPYFRMALVNPF